MTRTVRLALWTVPGLFCLWLYWYGLKVWFFQDDFAWLSLHTQVFDRHSLLTQMFEPMAQGTIRPWSERGFFLLFYWLFGADALPWRIFVFVTQFVNLLLLGWIVLRLTASRLAAFAAPLLWAANAALATAMSWSSDYNEILCAFFLLSAFALYLRGHYRLQIVVFVLGFGALELNVVYPAIVLAYVITCRRSREQMLRTVPLFAISVVYYVLHRWAAPMPASGPYALHLDFGMLHTFATYWSWAFAPENWTHYQWKSIAITVVFTALTAVHVAAETRRRHYFAIFSILWFVITIAPLVPLRAHMTNYYLTIPTIGLAMLLSGMLAEAASLRGSWQVAAVGVLLGFYLLVHIPMARRQTRWYLERSREVREVVLGIRHARELHPYQGILLTGISQNFADFALAHSPFHALDISDVYVEAGTPYAVNTLELAPGPAARAVMDGEVVVYSVAGGPPRNITSTWELKAFAANEKNYPRRVDAGNRFLTYLLGSTWYPLESDHRWMPQRASVRMGGPLAPNDKLILTGYCPEELIGSVPLVLKVSVDGNLLPEARFLRPEAPFTRIFSLPSDLAGKEYVDVTLEVSRTFAASGGGRALGLAFGVFEIR